MSQALFSEVRKQSLTIQNHETSCISVFSEGSVNQMHSAKQALFSEVRKQSLTIQNHETSCISVFSEGSVNQMHSAKQKDTSSANRSFIHAKKCIQSGDHFQAEAYLRESISWDPSFNPSLIDLGCLLQFDKGENQEAEVCYRRALELEPGNPQIITNLAWLLLQRGDHLGANRLFDDALPHVPDPETYRSAACVLKTLASTLAIGPKQSVAATSCPNRESAFALNAELGFSDGPA